MSVRSFRTSSIRTGEKRSKFWDQSAVVLNPAFESIATATGTGSSNTITFSSIPATYQHLQIRATLKSDRTSTGTGLGFRLQFNGSTSGYGNHQFFGDGTLTGVGPYLAGSDMFILFPAAGSATGMTNIVGTIILDIHDYANTSKNTTVRGFGGADANGAGYVCLHSGLWQNTSAVSSISFFVSDNWTNQTTFALYGIKSGA